MMAVAILIGFAGATQAASITLNNPLCPTANAAGCVSNISSLIATVTTYLTSIIGLIAVIIFIWAGILFVTSAGDAGQISQAKRAVLYAFIGLAIALMGSGLVLVIKSVIGTPPSSTSPGGGAGTP